MRILSYSEINVTFPSNFFVLVKTTVLAGMLIPIEKVSVANKHLINPS